MGEWIWKDWVVNIEKNTIVLNSQSTKMMFLNYNSNITILDDRTFGKDCLGW